MFVCSIHVLSACLFIICRLSVYPTFSQYPCLSARSACLCILCAAAISCPSNVTFNTVHPCGEFEFRNRNTHQEHCLIIHHCEASSPLMENKPIHTQRTHTYTHIHTHTTQTHGRARKGPDTKTIRQEQLQEEKEHKHDSVGRGSNF